jgi:ribosomal protein S18 acetylase RimI-like enzyme
VAARGWRALEQQRLGDWLLRASGGFTGRGNSALAVGDPGVDRSAAIDLVEGWYADRGLPPRLQLPDPAGSAELDRELADRGWSASPRVHVMTAELGPVLRGLPPTGVDVLLADRPDDAWLSVYRQDAAERSEVGASAPAAVALLVNHDNVVFVSVRDGDRCVAVARASVDERWTGLFCVEVVTDRRREGLARAVSIAALQWSGRHGARRCYLQVSSDNDAGTGLYSGLGFTVHHDYIYRAAPPRP